MKVRTIRGSGDAKRPYASYKKLTASEKEAKRKNVVKLWKERPEEISKNKDGRKGKAKREDCYPWQLPKRRLLRCGQ